MVHHLLSRSRISLFLISISIYSVSTADINWNGNDWAMGCDFRGRDLTNVRSSGEQCSGKCAQTSGCTHYAWNKWNGGTCWMKYGSVSKRNAFSSRDQNMVCGVLSSNDKSNDGNWNLVWEDNFNRIGGVDTNKWSFDVGGNGWGNNEQQYYTNDQRKNARCENGRLIVEAHRENKEGHKFTSARLKSKASWTYGRLQIRAKLPSGRGLWSALWMLPVKQTYSSSWPGNGEIDLMEQVGYDPLKVHSAVHTESYNHMKNTQPTNSVTVHDAVTNFKIYTLDWNADKMEMFVGDEGNPFTTRILVWDKKGDWKQWPFDQPFYIIINIAVGGNWGGLKGVDDSIFPRRMEIDWVRFYQRR